MDVTQLEGGVGISPPPVREGGADCGDGLLANGDGLVETTAEEAAEPADAVAGGIVSFLKDQYILITGATGFLAKLLVEKVLYEQPDVGHLYLLIQPRGDQSAEQRLDALLKSPVFDRLRARYAGVEGGFARLAASKVSAVPGNVAEEGLGVSPEDARALSERITVLINSAATTTFDEQFDVALKVNTLGALHCIRFAKACPRVTQVVQVSTAFVNGTRRGYTPEKPFVPGDSIARELRGDDAPHLDVDAEIRSALSSARAAEASARERGITAEADFRNAVKNTMKEIGLEKARTHGWQDTYVFTKAMGEMLVSRERGDMPVAIVRPSIVESAWREPVRGWIEGIRMCDPIIIAYGKGQIDGFCGDPHGCLDVVPADMVVNAILAAMPRLHRREGSLDVYHVATSTANPLSNRVFVDAVTSHFRDSPMKDRRGEDIRVQDMAIFTSVQSYGAALFLRYQAPMYLKRLRETVMPWTAATGARKRKDVIIQKTYEQLAYLADIYRPYTFYECRFGAENTERLFAEMHPAEKDRFNFNLREIDWLEYLSGVHVHGIRSFVLKGRA